MLDVGRDEILAEQVPLKKYMGFGAFDNLDYEVSIDKSNQNQPVIAKVADGAVYEQTKSESISNDNYQFLDDTEPVLNYPLTEIKIESKIEEKERPVIVEKENSRI